jgi:uncharacterized repeat protein (TIGR03803 family)
MTLSSLTLPVLFAPAAARPAQAQTETVLYSFGTLANDGNTPYAGLVIDKQGNLYGTTSSGGAYNAGTLFEISSAGDYKVLYNFGRTHADGRNPYSKLLFDKKGNLYGTTSAGGLGRSYCDDGCGTVFKFTASTGKEKVLYRFGSFSGDGLTPYADLVFDVNGNLYGTTIGGGNSVGGTCQANGCGTAFMVNSKGKAIETVLHSFGGYSGDGVTPAGGLVFDAAGNLYGATEEGGNNNYGIVFEITSMGEEEVLYKFSNNEGGGEPSSGLIIDSLGNLYGTTKYGGSYTGEGTVYELTWGGQEEVLASFGGAYGVFPTGNLLSFQGNLFGTTQQGDTPTVFEVTSTGVLNILYTFGTNESCYPNGDLVVDEFGNFYGTTQRCGANNLGTVFKIAP